MPLYHFVVPLELLGLTDGSLAARPPAVSPTLSLPPCSGAQLKAELPASQSISNEPGAVEVADGRIAMMRRRSVRPLLVIQPGGRR
jgi:hypothetical protein